MCVCLLIPGCVLGIGGLRDSGYVYLYEYVCVLYASDLSVIEACVVVKLMVGLGCMWDLM